MNFTSLLVFLGLMATAGSSPVCPGECEDAKTHHQQFFKHIWDLQSSSVAPWSLRNDTEEGREPFLIKYAVCTDCTVKNMIAKPIYLGISVYKVIVRSSGSVWCRCPYRLAVGCTCVSEQQQ